MAPSRPNSSRMSMAFSGVSTSPFPKTGMCIRWLFLTAAIGCQLASPLYICARVLPCIEMALHPTSCKRSATSTILIESSSQPKRVFTVTGNLVCFTIASVRETIRSMSFKMPAPAPLLTTFLTGHPKLISIISGPLASTISMLFSIDSKTAPKI